MTVRAAFALGVLLASPAAWPCSTCACGDNTLTLMGAEKPFAGRLRGAIDYSVRGESMGSGAAREDIDEWRTTIGVSYSANAKLTFAAQVPLVRKRVTSPTLAEIDAQGMGDTDLIARGVAWQDRAALPRHLAGYRIGVRLDTTREVRDERGELVDVDGQPDAGATAPNLGLWYGYYAFPVFVSLSGNYLFYGHGDQGFDPGDAAVGSLLGQYAAGQRLALQLGVDWRHTGRNTFSGAVDENSGGTLVMGFAGLGLRLGEDLLLSGGVQVPALKDLNGVQDVSAAWRAGLAYDF